MGGRAKFVPGIPQVRSRVAALDFGVAEVGPLSRPTGWRRHFAAETPARIRLLALSIGTLVIAWAAVLGVETQQARAGLAAISDRRAPVVMAASDLYFVLNDMDAQLANVLLVGDEAHLGFTRSQAVDIFERRRMQGDADLQQVAAAAADPSGVRVVRGLLDELGRYEALAADVLLLQKQDGSPAGQPPTAALTEYRSATDLLRLTLLPAARSLVDQQAQTLEADYQAEHARAQAMLATTIVLGIVLLFLLVLLQVYLTRRFQRLVNPALVAASLVVLGLLTAGVALAGGHEERLRTAKKDAFDSIMVLEQARAVSYDANADESRYLLDPHRAGQYEQAFLAKTQQVLGLDGATLATFDQRFDAAALAYDRDHRQVGWGGYLGSEFRNITFGGERAAAELTLDRYQIYQADDRRIRRLVTSGQQRAAIAFCTSYAPGASNYAFDQYDTALTALIGINEKAFQTAVRDDERNLTRWILVPGAGALAVVLLLFLGLRPRLAEYR